MKYLTNDKRGFNSRHHKRLPDQSIAADQMNAILITNARIYLSSHLDVPRTVSSQCFLDDGDIAATVRDAISCVTAVPDGTLQIGVENGWVTLRGTLGDLAQRECVERITLHSVGVRGVVNSIMVHETRSTSYENSQSIFE